MHKAVSTDWTPVLRTKNSSYREGSSLGCRGGGGVPSRIGWSRVFSREMDRGSGGVGGF